MDPLEEMEAIAADPDYCPTCHTKFLVDDRGVRACAGRCRERERNSMEPVVDGSAFEPTVITKDAPLEVILNEYATLGAAFRDVRNKWAVNREEIGQFQRKSLELSQQMEALNQRHAAAIEGLRRNNQMLESDLRIISEALYEEACNRDWCAEYDEFADDVNSRTHGTWLQIRQTEYDQRFIVSVSWKCRPANRDDVLSEIVSSLESCGEGVSTDCDDFDVSVDYG